MNKQGPNGIEWTDYTWNPLGGCLHGCAWTMPDGNVANCYAEDVASGVAAAFYPNGFEAAYWRPDALQEPMKVNKPSKIFCGSMTDVFGHWNDTAHIQAILDVCASYPQHTFQFLTKNPKRLTAFHFPANCWIGISVPPTFMWGKELTRHQQVQWMEASCDALFACDASIRWLSAEPLTFCFAPAFALCPFDWVVIGAASRGKTYYQPDPLDVQLMLAEADARHIPVFFKGNLKWSPWRAEFPETASVKQLALL